MCEAIFAVPKYVASKLEWRPEGDRTVKFRAQVLSVDNSTALDLIGYWGFNPRYSRKIWGFNLSYRKHCIRQYDMAAKHKNFGEVGSIRGPHKHRFSSSRIPRYAYKPNPPISESNPNQALMDFLDEANVRRPEDYQSFMFF
jgi:hypothetical protein